MTQDRIAGGNFSIASCGHPFRPGEDAVVDNDARRLDCPMCSFDQLRALITEELQFLQQLAALDE